MPRVHLVASVDHVNASLLWSKREAARFNWVWQEATTFAPYKLETANVPQLLASKGEQRHIRGAVGLYTLNPALIHRLKAPEITK
jgi:origin recognition complex subunit 2